MLRRREQLVGVAVFVVLAVLGVLVLLLVRDAERSGRRALEQAVTGEVQAIARSQNSRVVSQLTGAAGLAERPWELTVGSDADREELEEILELVPTLRTGFFLTDLDGTITQGVQIEPPADVGDRYVRPGFDEAFTSPVFLTGQGVLLRVADGITTDIPTLAFVYPLLDEQRSVRGTFVFESDVAPDSAFNEEIGELQRGETGSYLVFDTAGAIIAANDASLIGEQVSDEAFLTADPGLHRRDGELLVVAEVPAAMWRIAFTQDIDEFESGLSGPLQQLGQVVLVVFLVVGFVLAVALVRRLRAAREEQLRLRRLAESQEEFISIVSHELRTPVSGVLGFLQTTLDHWDAMTDTERLHAIRRSASNARRLQGLTRDVLDSQSVESGRMAYVMGEADLRDEVGAAIESAEALYPTVAFVRDLAPGESPVLADADRIQQVLNNLLDNAAKVSPPDTEIVVRLVRDDDRVRVSVSDEGPGLSDELRTKVFDKFVRGPSESVTGTGLGLYIAKQIVEAHRGSIWVESAAGQGATFVLELPLRTASVAD